MPFRALRRVALPLLLAPVALVLAAANPPQSAVAPNPKVPPGARSSGGLHARLETDKGVIEMELFPSDCPRAVENFRLLAEHGYYDGTIFHRVVRGFMIQGGQPADGSGGVSAWGGTFADEIRKDSPLYRAGYRRGIVAMANAGPNTNTCEFFIMHGDVRLPPVYVIFGRVTRGIEVVDAVANAPTTTGPFGPHSKPVVPTVVRKITILP
jgi:cyclophilin family peptidyl-prolyl cis-trans isomerase